MRSAAAALAAALALAPALAARAEEPQKPAAPAPKTAAPQPPHAAPSSPKPPQDTAKTLYGLGVAIATSLEVFALSPAEIETVLSGIRDTSAGKPRFQLDAKMQEAVSELARTRAPKAQEKAAAREKQQGPAYLAKMAKESGAKKTPSGAIVIPIKEGAGASPTPADKVKVNYTGTLVSGRVFDSSAQRGPAEFALGKVVRCWTEALPLMKVGGTAKIVCPPEIAYGPGGNGAVPGNAVLTFEVELVDVVKDVAK